MIKKISTSKKIIGITTGVLFCAPLFASALSVDLSADAKTSTMTSTGVKAEVKVDARLEKITARSEKAISARIDDLNKLNARVQAMTNVSETEKSVIAASVQTNITGLNALKAKIDADTDVATATTDEKSILSSYRIYALVVPQGYIIASADRVITVAGLLTSAGTKLQVRISAVQAAGGDVTSLQKTLADVALKITDAQTQATAANTAAVSLVPDQGDKAKMQANTEALKSARVHIKTATADLHAARADINIIIDALKKIETKVKINAKVSASATTTQNVPAGSMAQ